METRDLAALERQYAAIQAAKKAMCRVPIAPAEPVDTTPPVLPQESLKQPTETVPNEYGNYVGIGCP